MKILIIRHGESEADILKVHEGRADFNLTDKGKKQAECMAKYIKANLNVSKIYSSTLKRARQTAEILNNQYNFKINFEEDLMEFNNGLLAGLSHEEVLKKYPEVPNLPIDKSVYGQESKLEFRKRAEKVLNKIINETKEDDVIAIVTHGGMINQLYGVFLNIPIISNIFFKTSDTGIHVWEINDNKRKIINANMIEHIKD